jgi:choline dehydrogenase-like flavoprotein
MDDRSTTDRHRTMIDTDVCIIGAGPAGITLARELVGQPFRVCLLEAGGREPEHDVRPVAHGAVTGLSYDQLDVPRLRGFGGNSHRWFLPVPGGHGLRLRPLDAIDFEQRAGVPFSGWPFDRRHLEPYYERANQAFRAGPFRYEPEHWEDEGRAQWSLGDGVVSPIFQFALGDWFYDDDRTELDRSPNVTTILHANVRELELDDAGVAVDAVLVCTDPAGQCVINPPGDDRDVPLALPGSTFRVKAKVFVLACGGTENPRLLLASNRDRERGLGNQHDLVGRFFMEHLHLWSARFIPSDRSLFARGGLYEPHVVRGVQVVAKLALAERVLRDEGLLNYCVGLHPDGWSEGVRSLDQLVRSIRTRRRPPALGRHLRNVVADRRDVAGAVRRRAARKLAGRRNDEAVSQSAAPAVYLLSSMSEQAPNPSSRVRLSGRRDALGRPRVELDWRVGDLDLHTVDRAQQLLDSELRRTGLGRLQIDRRPCDIPDDEIHGGWHHMGTTRMHPDPTQGVVDRHGRVHGVPNLFVAGSSVFPTVGYANPALTVVAMAIRLAEHVTAEMRATVAVH